MIKLEWLDSKHSSSFTLVDLLQGFHWRSRPIEA